MATSGRAAGVELHAEPMRLLGNIYIVVGILVLTFGLSTYVDVKTEAMHLRQLEIGTRLERMVRLKDALSDTLVIAVLERSTQRSEGYDELNGRLEATLREVDQLSRGGRLSDELAALERDQLLLRASEARAIGFMRLGDWTAARAVLFDDDYVRARTDYERNSETAIDALDRELTSQTRRFDRLRQGTSVLRVAALLALLWVGAKFSRRLRREIAEQARLRAEVQAANDMLEQSVQKRTAELEAANRQLEALSTTDGLTGLANRRKFDEVWAAEWSRALRLRMPLAVAMIDVDFFKAYNDHLGHQAGDECLRRLGHILATEARRAGELIARYGGEEFVLVLPGAGTAQATAIAERIRDAVESARIPHPHSTLGAYLTVSAGVASGLPTQGEDAGRLVELADMALYAAKLEGRNRVVVAP